MTNRTRLLSAAPLFATLVLLAPQAHAGDPTKGKTSYEARCAFCHGMTGKGDGIAGASLQPPPTNFTSADYWTSSTPERRRDVIENGKPGTAMVAFKVTLKPGESDDLLAYIDTFRPK